MLTIKRALAKLLQALGLFGFIQKIRGREYYPPQAEPDAATLALQAQIATQQSLIDTQQAQAEGQSAQIASLQAQAEGQSAQIASLQAQVEDLLREPEPEPFVHQPYISKEMQLRMDIAAAVTNMEGLRQAAQAINYTYFTDYDAQITTKQREFRAAVVHFDIDIKNACVLDIGPGTADSLDAALEMGAKETLFIEEEPFFVKFAEFKGHSGVMKNYTFTPHFEGLKPGSIDLIYTKGSINCEWVNTQDRLRKEDHIDHYFKFDDWLDEMITLLKPGTGRIILMPAMDMQNERIIDEEYDLDTYYWCPNVEAYRNSYFSQTLVKKGFKMVEGIKGFNQPLAFPIAFYYDGK